MTKPMSKKPAYKMSIRMTARHWLLRISICANFFVLIYIALYTSTTTYPTSTTPLDPGTIALPRVADPPDDTPQQEMIQQPDLLQPLQSPQPQQQSYPDTPLNEKSDSSDFSEDNLIPVVVGAADESKFSKSSPLSSRERESQGQSLSATSRLLPCDDSQSRSHMGQRGPFWVLYNYITASRRVKCDESITYTTHADFTFLDNLIPLLERWEGPISLSMYAPGTDFNETLKRILFLRECTGYSLVKELVSFHLFFDYKHIPRYIPRDPMSLQVNCTEYSDLKFEEGLPTYKKSKKLPYPVNVARNVAREMSLTHYILPSDIELYPNPNLIRDFLAMIRRNTTELQRPNPKVYVLSIFEVEASVRGLPADKVELLQMLGNRSAIPFHKYVCSDCHRIPKAKEWLEIGVGEGLNVFHIGKRLKPFHHWEPIYIGTKFDPMYDERLTWEGRSDKMTQGYVLCVLDYEFHILDNAFLVHRPGIKTKVTIPSKTPVVAKQNTIIARIILPELKLLYGTRPGCFV